MEEIYKNKKHPKHDASLDYIRDSHFFYEHIDMVLNSFPRNKKPLLVEDMNPILKKIFIHEYEFKKHQEKVLNRLMNK